MARKRLSVVNFGVSKTGLATVGYTVYGSDGAVAYARSTAGVNEVGATGIYQADVTLPDYEALILWDTGEGSPKYAPETYNYQISYIQDEVSRIQSIWNSLRNQGEFFSKLMDKMGMLQKNEGLGKVEKKIDSLVERDYTSLTNIEEAFKKAAGTIKIEAPKVDVPAPVVNMPAPVVNIPETKIPNYSGNFASLLGVLREMQKSINSKSEDSAKIDKALVSLQAVFSKLDGVLSKIQTLNDTVSDKSDKKEIMQAIKGLNDFIKGLAMTKQNMDILMSLGHKR